MGYYTRLEFQMKIKPEFIKKVQKRVEKAREDDKEGYFEWALQLTIVDDDGIIYMDDELKFYEEQSYIYYLSTRLEKGDLICYGEDYLRRIYNKTWGYRFDGKGNVSKLKMMMVEEEK